MTTLFTASVTGQTIAGVGVVFINDDRPRSPSLSAAVTLNNTDADGTQYDVYAQAQAANTYRLIALLHGASIAAYGSSVVIVGYAYNYPLSGRAEWVPLPGGALDPYLSVDAMGALTIGKPDGSSKARVDRNGRLSSTANTVPVVVTGAGAGPSAPFLLEGSDQWGHVIVYTQVAPIADALIFRLTFAKPFIHTPYAVILSIVNAGITDAQWTSAMRNAFPAVTTTYFELRSPIGFALIAPTTYEFKYVVLGGD